MFVKVELTDVILIEPEDLKADFQQLLQQKITQKYTSKVSLSSYLRSYQTKMSAITVITVMTPPSPYQTKASACGCCPSGARSRRCSSTRAT